MCGQVRNAPGLKDSYDSAPSELTCGGNNRAAVTVILSPTLRVKKGHDSDYESVECSYSGARDLFPPCEMNRCSAPFRLGCLQQRISRRTQVLAIMIRRSRTFVPVVPLTIVSPMASKKVKESLFNRKR